MPPPIPPPVPPRRAPASPVPPPPPPPAPRGGPPAIAREFRGGSRFLGPTWERLRVEPECLVLTNRAGRQVTLAPAEVRLIAGETGVSLNGGDVLVWKSLHLTTAAGRRYTFRFTPEVNAQAYAALAAVCLSAVGITAKGKVDLPALEGDLATWTATVARLVRREFLRQGLQAAVAGLASVAVGVAMIWALVLQFHRNPDNTGGGRLGVIGAVSTIIGVCLLGMSLQKAWRGVSLAGRIGATQRGRPLDVAALEPGAAAPTEPTSIVLATLAIASLVLMCLPVLPGILAAVVLWRGSRQASWLKALAIVGLVLSLITSAWFVLVVVLK